MKEIVSHTGTYSVKMALGRQIPQFLPMGGKKIKIYYRGIRKMCRKCYRAGHLWNDCKNRQREWVEYVDEFMLNHTLEEQMYGNWIRLVLDWRIRNQDLHEGNKAKVVNQKEYLRGQVEEIKTAMERQKEQESAPASGSKDDKEEHGSANEVESTATGACGAVPVSSPIPTENQVVGDEALSKEELLRKAVMSMTVEELEEIANTKKRGRPKNEDKELKQLSRQVLNRKKSVGGGANQKTA